MNSVGAYLRSLFREKGLTVAASARLLGVGRPALSNLVNGHARLTPEMAARIEIAFGVPAKRLLDLEAEWAASNARVAPSNTRRHVVPFLQPRARDIESWANRNIAARARLAVFLRTLVNSTGLDLRQVDFPGNDDAERPGWDGLVEAGQGTPWIPEGRSGWEFGTTEEAGAKADGDFRKSVKATPKAERSSITFVFVTPRHWTKKAEWIETNRAKQQWKDVVAYDSSDLEQWIEQSIAGQVWFATETGDPSQGVKTLERSWRDWAEVATPPLPDSLFSSAVEGAQQAVAALLAKAPSEPIVVAADSTEEGIAFISQLFGDRGGEKLQRHKDRVLVFTATGVLPKIAEGTRDFIAVAGTREVERELGALRSLHSFTVYPRNATTATPLVSLEPLNYEAFRASLASVGYNNEDIERLSKESGRSLTVLRRRLSRVPAIRVPSWAEDTSIASKLVPFLLVGAWTATNPADQDAIREVARASCYDDIEREAQRLASLADPPLWSIGGHRGVVSKIDLLFAISPIITGPELRRYFDLAAAVLGEDDPALDLDEEKRWAATLYGKRRAFSPSLRDGVRESLVLLAVHGNTLFKRRLGLDCEHEVENLVHRLLSPLSSRVLEANDRDLSAYAEAAPHTFLSIIEEDLRRPEPACYALMRPVGSDAFASCARTGLLWALEGLAWNAGTLSRTALILAQLSQIEILDNWVNKPINSLKSIFSSWMPQTAATPAQRLTALGLIKIRFPSVAWAVCVEQLEGGQKIGHHNHKPKWRNDAYGFGEPYKTWGPVLEFNRAVADIALAWGDEYTREMVSDLIERLRYFDALYQTKAWAIVDRWAKGASERDRATVREKIRVTVLSRRARRQSKGTDFAAMTQAATKSYDALEPANLLDKHAWLFRKVWIDESADEIHQDDLDYEKRDERIAALRTNALREVVNQLGTTGLLQLADQGHTAFQIGWLARDRLLRDQGVERVTEFLLQMLPQTPNEATASWKLFVSGFLAADYAHDPNAQVLDHIRKRVPEAEFIGVVLLAPLRRGIWMKVETCSPEMRRQYWTDVNANWIRSDSSELGEAIEYLLAAGRPRAAFELAHFDLKAVPAEVLFRVMSEMLKDGNDKPGEHRLEEYYVQEAFKVLDKSPLLNLEQKAGLEFAYIEALSHPWRDRSEYGIPNLEKYIELHPDLFVQAIVWTYKRSDDGDDPSEMQVSEDRRKVLAERGWKLLDGITRIPGSDENERQTLATWVTTVREACASLARADVGDICVGKVLGRSPIGGDGVWPSEPVRQVMEEIQSRQLMQGAHTAIYNSRGVVWRGEGGSQERALAAKYQVWADALQYSHPFVASNLLMQLVRTYEHEAEREDIEASVNRRLR
jgi:plasmid maintenance system antidote protein VapI